jgi:hypothetical protein
MQTEEVHAFLGSVMVMSTQGRGFTPEEIAERALDKIIAVSGNAPPVIAEQAHAFRENIRRVLVYYMHEVVKSHNTTIINKLTNAGYPELAAILAD